MNATSEPTVEWTAHVNATSERAVEVPISVSVLPSANASTGYIGGATLLQGTWDGFAAGSHVSSLSYDVCVGTSPSGCQAQEFTPVESSAASYQPSPTLSCGVRHYMTVRATNCAGLQHVVSSEGAKICCSEPRGGTVSVRDASGKAVTYVSGAEASLMVGWHGFAEPCSGLRDFTVSLGSLADGSTTWQQHVLDASNSTHALLIPAAVLSSLSHGADYTVQVIATSHAGLTGVASATLTVDKTPPSGPFLVSLPSCVSTAVPLSCNWRHTPLTQSSLARMEWALGTEPFQEDVRAFAEVPVTNLSATTESALALSAGSTVFCTVRLTGRSNLSSVFASAGTKLIDTEACSEPFLCLPSPWSQLMMASVAFIPPASDPARAPFSPMQEHRYQINSHVSVPQHGSFTFVTQLRLTEHAAEALAEERLYEMSVESNYMVDEQGSHHPLTGKDDMRRFPFFYRRHSNGSIGSVSHHKHESVRVVGSKRFMASAHHHPHLNASGLRPVRTDIVAVSPNALERTGTMETDAVGPSVVTYRVRGGAGLIRPNQVVYKRQRAMLAHRLYRTDSSTRRTRPSSRMPTTPCLG